MPPADGSRTFPQWNYPDGPRARGSRARPTRRSSTGRRTRIRPTPSTTSRSAAWIYEARAKVAVDPGAQQGDLDGAEKLIAENRKWNPSWAPAPARGDDGGGAAPREGARRVQVAAAQPHGTGPATSRPSTSSSSSRPSTTPGFRSARCPTRRPSSRTSSSRVVGVLDASRGYLATFADGRRAPRRGARRASPSGPAEAVVAQDEFLREVLGVRRARSRREKFKLLGTPVLGRGRRARSSAAGRPLGVLVLADKEVRRGRTGRVRRGGRAASSSRSRASAAWRSRTAGTSSG